MKWKIQFLFVIFTYPVIHSFDRQNKYCLIDKCALGTHTLCRYNITGPHQRCDRVIRSGLTENERRTILSVHNFYRAKVFSGNERRGNPGPQPPAVRFTPLRWNDELEKVAHRWTDQCLPYPDFCRHMNESLVGQNIAWQDFDEDMDAELERNYLQELIETWYNEVVRFSRRSTKRFNLIRARNSSTLYYSQMVWGNTIHIGCSAIRYHKLSFQIPKILLICNYGPSGNCNNEPVYQSL